MATKTMSHRGGLRACVGLALLAPLAACDEDSMLLMATRNPQPQLEVEAVVVTPEFVRHGTQLPISVQLRNRGQQPLTVPVIGTTQQVVFDVWLTAPDGTIVWQLRSPSEPVPTTTTNLTLAAGSQLSLPATWDLRLESGAFVPPGTYRVDARVLTPTGAIIARPTSVLITT